MYVEKYFSEVQKVMDEVLKTQKDKMEQAAAKLVETCEKGGRIFFFGCTHAGILSQEAFYRTGGLVVVNPILPPGPVSYTHLDVYKRQIPSWSMAGR